MNEADKIDPNFYDTHCFGADFIEAEANGDLIIGRPGETVLDAFERHKREKESKKEAIA